jgi:hypothetical protein
VPRRSRGGSPSRIHQGLVGRRALIGTPYLADRELRREYVDEIAPRTEAALGKILAELFGAGAERNGGRVSSVVDLGAGTGAAGSAVRAFFRSGSGSDSVRVVSVDRIGGPGVLARDLSAPGALAGLGREFDLVVAAHVLNELFVGLPVEQRVAARARKVLGWCETLLAVGGTAIILEPALRETSRDLLAVRDLVVAAGLRVVAPCLWAGACPALARERDWCHDAAAGDSPGAPRVDFSYLALRREGNVVTDPELFRIVSDPLVEKGRLRLYGCGPAGRHALVRLDRHRSPSNAEFDRLRRGQIARVAGAVAAGDGLRIDAAADVSTSAAAASESERR